jgi:hypothetical protein
MNVIDVTVNDRDIPAGKVLLARTKPEGETFTQEHVLDRKTGWKDSDFGRPTEVRLVGRIAGWALAGSMLRWDNGAYGVLWNINGSRFGNWYKTFDEAVAHFNRIP